MSRRLPLYKTSRVLYDRVTHEREVSAMAAVVGLHLWKRKLLLSVAGGTILYMALVQLVF